MIENQGFKILNYSVGFRVEILVKSPKTTQSCCAQNVKYFDFAAMKNKEFNHILGRQIKRAREEKGITQEELASRMNVNSQNISSYERGERCPSIFWMNRLYEALDIEAVTFTEDLYQKLNSVALSPNITIINPVSKGPVTENPITDKPVSDSQVSTEEI